MDSIRRHLDEVRLDWSDFETAGAESRRILAEICQDRGALSSLIATALEEPRLRDRCESHQLLDYLVVYDALDRGLRLRLHLSTSDHLQRVHDHRFDFSSYIVCGKYEHCLIEPRLDLYAESEEELALAHQDKSNPDPSLVLTNEDFPTVFVRNEVRDSTYSFSHELAHTVLTTKDTVSLVLRGPAMRRRSFIFDRATESLWWRFGQDDETSNRRNEKRMSDEQLAGTLAALERLEVIRI